MVTKKVISGWTLGNPENGTYFLSRDDEKTTWTNSYTEAKKWDTKEEAEKFFQYLKKQNLHFSLDNTKIVHVSYEGYYE